LRYQPDRGPDIAVGILAAVKRVLLLAVAAGTLTVGGAPPVPARAGPALHVTALRPVVVRGTGFRPGERLTVVLVLGGREARTVRAGARGSFVSRFEEHAELCRAFTLRVLRGPTLRATGGHKPPPSCAALDPVR
jgi:hypothetical protein